MKHVSLLQDAGCKDENVLFILLKQAGIEFKWTCTAANYYHNKSNIMVKKQIMEKNEFYVTVFHATDCFSSIQSTIF